MINFDKSQLQCLNNIIDSSGNCIVTGSAGTGKSILAKFLFTYFRAQKRANPRLLMYNRPLCTYLQDQSAEEDRYFIQTFDYWICKNVTHSSYPDAKICGIMNKINSHFIPKKKYNAIIIDEAQDIPLPLLTLFKNYSDRIICFIDPNQAIQKEKTDVPAIQRTLNVQTIFQLTQNYRNPQGIIDAARPFWNGESVFPAQSKIESDVKPFLHNTYNGNGAMEQICNIIRDNSDKKIGIFANTSELEDFGKTLRDNGIENTQIYMNDRNASRRFDFSKNDVFLLSFGTMKGLEFDIVILPRIGRIKKQPFAETNPDADKNVIYTAMTRAKGELHIFAWHDTPADKYIDAEAAVWKNRQFFQIA